MKHRSINAFKINLWNIEEIGIVQQKPWYNKTPYAEHASKALQRHSSCPDLKPRLPILPEDLSNP